MSWQLPYSGRFNVDWCDRSAACPFHYLILDSPETLLDCINWPYCGLWHSAGVYAAGTPVSLHFRRTVNNVTTNFYPTSINYLGKDYVQFIFDIEGAQANVLVTLYRVTLTCPFPTVTMISPEDGTYYFTCPDNDYTLQEVETHTPTSGNCVPTIQWKEMLLDQGGGTWHGEQDIHTAELMPQNHGTSSRMLVVQVKAENSQGGVAIDRATITLYKAQDRLIEEYRALIDAAATAAANDVGVDVETFKTYMKAQLCVESGWQGYKLGYCSPTVGPNKNKQGQIVSRDWGIAQMNDKAWKQGKKVVDPRGGVLFGPIDDNRRMWDPFYGIRFQAKLLSRFFLLMRRREFNGLTLTQKFQNAMVMYNAGPARAIWKSDPTASEYAYKNRYLEKLVKNDPNLVERMFNYFGHVNDKIQNPCHP